MKDLFQYFLLAIAIILTSVITEYTKNKRWKVSLLAALGLLGLYLTWTKEIQAESKQREEKKEERRVNDSTVSENKRISDSVGQERIDSAVNKIAATFGKAVGEYDIEMKKKFDGMYKLVRDSSKDVVNQIESQEPYFGLCAGTKAQVTYVPITIQNLRDNHYSFEMEFCSYNSTATNIDVKYLVMSRTNNKALKIIHKGQVLYKNYQLSPNISQSFVFEPASPIYEDVFFYFYGTYKNSSKTKVFFVNQIKEFNLKDGRAKRMTTLDERIFRDWYREEIKEVDSFLRRHNLDDE